MNEIIYNKAKDFAVNEILSPMSPEDFKAEIDDFMELLSNVALIAVETGELYYYSLDEDETNTLSIYYSNKLISFEYEDLDLNVSFSVEKFIP